MARKRKAKKTGTRRRRRSRMGKVDFMEPLYMVGGAIAGNFIKSFAKPMLTFAGKDYSGVAVLAAGVFGKQLVKDPIMKSVCDGLIVSGGISTVHTFIPAVPINGIDMIGGYFAPNTIQGLPMGRVGAIDEIGNANFFMPANEVEADY